MYVMYTIALLADAMNTNTTTTTTTSILTYLSLIDTGDGVVSTSGAARADDVTVQLTLTT